MLVPVMTAPSQPIKRAMLPRQDDPDLRLAVLNWQTALGNLGTDYSAAGDDLIPINGPVTAPRAGCRFVAASLQYLQRAEVNWRLADTVGMISAWIKLDSIGVRRAIWGSSEETANNRHLEFFVDSTNVVGIRCITPTFNNIIIGSTTLVADRWYYLVAVSTGSTYLLYVDGSIETLNIVSGTIDGSWLNSNPVGRVNITVGVLHRIGLAGLFDGTILDTRYYSRVLSVDEIKYQYQQGVPDDSLLLHVFDGTRDLSKYERTLVPAGGIVFGHFITFDGVDDAIDCGDLGNIQTIGMWINPDTDTEEILLVDAGKDIMVNGGTVTYTGLTPVATYVNGVASTTLAADRWQYLVCVLETVDANNFELGTDGVNFGDMDLRDVKVFSEVKAARYVKAYYEKTRIYF